MEKILVIEDSAQNRDLFIEALEAEGFHTIGAENGLVGVQRAQDGLPDLVICDIMMPQLDGYGVLSTLRQDPVTAIIPFIFLTAKGTKAEIRQGMEMGADDYLTKPCTVKELLGAIAAGLEKRANLRKWYTAQSQSVAEAPEAKTTKLAVSKSIFPSDPQLSEVFRFIEANYHRSITLRDVALAVDYSSTYLTNLVGRQTGQTVQSWIILRRMAAARSLLLETDEKVEAIAQALGYQCAVHFFRQFRQHHGTTPHAWRTVGRSTVQQTQEPRKC